MKHIPSSTFNTTNWSGGTTTELFIWPEHSSYAARDFEFRLSRATVNIETSTFTPLAGFKRTLMVLTGEMELNHEGQHSCVLKPFEVDQFDGGWTTHSKGKCSDFNLMCSGDKFGKLSQVYLSEGQRDRIELPGKYHLFYVYSGEVEVGGIVARTGDLVVFEDEDNVEVCGRVEVVGILVEV